MSRKFNARTARGRFLTVATVLVLIVIAAIVLASAK